MQQNIRSCLRLQITISGLHDQTQRPELVLGDNAVQDKVVPAGRAGEVGRLESSADIVSAFTGPPWTAIS